ncbi:hypothetical protein ATC00_02560 [Sinorhizobium americanum]|nr:hypothetical protein ATC00_02560 [Sinorhizobium americanum]
MSLERILRLVEGATGSDRRLDVILGRLIGYKMVEGGSTDADPLEAHWVREDGKPVKMPRFSESVDAAWRFSSSLCPGAEILAVTFGQDMPKAQVNSSKAEGLAEPALALCAAAIRARLEGDRRPPI